eukprot:UN23770
MIVEKSQGEENLLTACENSNWDDAINIIGEGGNINVKSADTGRTPLLMASIDGSIDAVMAILQANADINVQDNDKQSALTYAIKKQHIQLAHLLISKNIDISIRNKRGNTALMLAAWRAEFDLCKSLIELNARIDTCNVDDMNAIAFAVRYSSQERDQLANY